MQRRQEIERRNHRNNHVGDGSGRLTIGYLILGIFLADPIHRFVDRQGTLEFGRVDFFNTDRVKYELVPYGDRGQSGRKTLWTGSPKRGPHPSGRKQLV